MPLVAVLFLRELTVHNLAVDRAPIEVVSQERDVQPRGVYQEEIVRLIGMVQEVDELATQEKPTPDGA